MGPDKKVCANICSPSSVQVHKCVSILPNDYNIMENKPVINGVVLEGEQSAKTLNLLSSNAEDYDETTFAEAKERDGYMVVILSDNQPQKVSLCDLSANMGGDGSLRTVDELDTSATVGSYQFVEKK